MAMLRMSSSLQQWAITVSTHRHPFSAIKPPAKLFFGSKSSQTSLQAKATTSQESPKKPSPASRLLPDDKPAESTFPWDGGAPSRSLLLLDGNAILYRAYFKIMAKVQYGALRDMGSESDWVLTVFTALSTILRLLHTRPSHAAAAFDYKGLTFRHLLFPQYKLGRPPTPDTVNQALTCLKPALLSLGIPVVEVPGVEADDVIATLALRAVEEEIHVSIASPDKDFFQLLSPKVRLLRFVPRGSGIVAFGEREFQERFSGIEPWQYLEVLALQGDKVDNIPGLPGIGEITALKLVREFGSVENLLLNRGKVRMKRARESLMADDGGVMLSRRLLSLKTDLSRCVLPWKVGELGCRRPGDGVAQFVKLVEAMGAYVDAAVAEELLERAAELWERWDEDAAKVEDSSPGGASEAVEESPTCTVK